MDGTKKNVIIVKRARFFPMSIFTISTNGSSADTLIFLLLIPLFNDCPEHMGNHPAELFTAATLPGSLPFPIKKIKNEYKYLLTISKNNIILHFCCDKRVHLKEQFND